MSAIRKVISKKITKALWDFKMIDPGDKILVAVSGGKDSTTLLCDLAGRMAEWKTPFTLGAVYVQSDFSNPSVATFVTSLCEKQNVPLAILPVSIIGRLKPGRQMNCYWCSMQRRIDILKYAIAEGYTKIALGHHLDDCIETYLMNLMQIGKGDGMNPNLKYDKYPVSLLRPLVYIEEHEIIAYVQDMDLLRYTCKCDYGENSERKRVRKVIADLTEGRSSRKSNLLKAAMATCGWVVGQDV